MNDREARPARRPANRTLRRRRAVVIAAGLLLVGMTVCPLSCARLNGAADKAYASLIETDKNVAQLETLAQSYDTYGKARLNNGIRGDFDSVAANSRRMNMISDQMVFAEERAAAAQKQKNEAFKKSTRWLFPGTSRRQASREIWVLSDAITGLRSQSIRWRRQLNAFDVQINGLYIKFASDEIGEDEFSEQKSALETKREPVLASYAKLMKSIKTKEDQIFAMNTAFNVE